MKNTKQPAGMIGHNIMHMLSAVIIFTAILSGACTAFKAQSGDGSHTSENQGNHTKTLVYDVDGLETSDRVKNSQNAYRPLE